MVPLPISSIEPFQLIIAGENSAVPGVSIGRLALLGVNAVQFCRLLSPHRRKHSKMDIGRSCLGQFCDAHPAKQVDAICGHSDPHLIKVFRPESS